VRLGARFWIDYRYKDGLARLIANYDVAQFFSDLPKQAQVTGLGVRPFARPTGRDPSNLLTGLYSNRPNARRTTSLIRRSARE
jgi:hypothetical protein